MIVIDASAVLEMLLGTAKAESIAGRVLADDETLHAPHLIDVEFAQALRRLLLGGHLTDGRAAEALEDFQLLAVERYSHAELLPRIWDLRESLTAYDAAYVALAESLAAPLLTCDAKLARAHGHSARVVLL